MKKLFFSVICAVFACFAARAQNTEYRLSTHILDIGTGMPAPNIAVKLFRQSPAENGRKSLTESPIQTAELPIFSLRTKTIREYSNSVLPQATISPGKNKTPSTLI